MQLHATGLAGCDRPHAPCFGPPAGCSLHLGQKVRPPSQPALQTAPQPAASQPPSQLPAGKGADGSKVLGRQQCVPVSQQAIVHDGGCGAASRMDRAFILTFGAPSPQHLPSKPAWPHATRTGLAAGRPRTPCVGALAGCSAQGNARAPRVLAPHASAQPPWSTGSQPQLSGTRAPQSPSQEHAGAAVPAQASQATQHGGASSSPGLLGSLAKDTACQGCSQPRTPPEDVAALHGRGPTAAGCSKPGVPLA